MKTLTKGRGTEPTDQHQTQKDDFPYDRKLGKMSPCDLPKYRPTRAVAYDGEHEATYTHGVKASVKEVWHNPTLIESLKHLDRLKTEVINYADQALDPFNLEGAKVLAFNRCLLSEAGGYQRYVVAFDGKHYFSVTIGTGIDCNYTLEANQENGTAMEMYADCDTRVVSFAKAFPGKSIPDELADVLGDGRANCTREQAIAEIWKGGAE